MALQRQLRVLDGTGGRDNTGPSGLRIAFATSDLKHVDQHFGSAERFAIYLVEPGRSTLLEVVQFRQHVQDGDENKLLEKLVLLDGCAGVFCHAVGGSAVRQLLSLGVQPFKVPDGTGIAGLLAGLQAELRNETAGWAARALTRVRRNDSGRFDAMEAEGWEE